MPFQAHHVDPNNGLTWISIRRSKYSNFKIRVTRHRWRPQTGAYWILWVVPVCFEVCLGRRTPQTTDLKLFEEVVLCKVKSLSLKSSHFYCFCSLLDDTQPKIFGVEDQPVFEWVSCGSFKSFFSINATSYFVCFIIELKWYLFFPVKSKYWSLKVWPSSCKCGEI